MSRPSLTTLPEFKDTEFLPGNPALAYERQQRLYRACDMTRERIAKEKAEKERAA